MEEDRECTFCEGEGEMSGIQCLDCCGAGFASDRLMQEICEQIDGLARGLGTAAMAAE